MSNNNQVSSQGATKGLLKYTKQPIQSTEQSNFMQMNKPNPNMVTGMGHKKNQYSTIVKSNYKNLVGDDVNQ
jgi:hypothetical protein